MISIDWASRVITVPREDLTLVQSSPTEIRNLDLNQFRLALKALESSDSGIVNPSTHRHNTEVSLGGLVYARTIELINNYTVTFEDGRYAVNLAGANSNVGDCVNVNQVSVRSQNSAGNTSSPAIEHASFNNQVTLDPVNGFSGSTFPIGTMLKPVNNLADALLIAAFRGFTTMHVIGHVTLAAADLSGFKIIGQNAVRSSITLASSLNIAKCELLDTCVIGVLDGDILLRDCMVMGVDYFNGIIHKCAFQMEVITLGGPSTAMFLDCYSAVAGSDERPCIDFNNQITPLAIRGWQGGLELRNKSTAAGAVSIDLSSGILYIRDTCTAGHITVRGTGKVIDESGPNCQVEYSGLIDPEYIQHMTYSGAVWVNETSSNAGLIFPIGNRETPVNNWSDAIQIAAARALTDFQVYGDIHLGEGVDLHGTRLIGSGALRTKIEIQELASVNQVEIVEATLYGVLDGGVIIRNCIIDGLSYLNGMLFSNAITEKPVVLGGPSMAMLMDCKSADTQRTPVVIDCNHDITPIVIRNWEGSLFIKNRTQDCFSSIHFNGCVTIDETCTAGSFYITGSGEVKDNSTGSCIVDSSRVISTQSITEGVWEKEIDTGYTSEEVLRIMAAVLAGKVSGANTSSIQFRDLTDTKTRVTALLDLQGNRTSVDLDPS